MGVPKLFTVLSKQNITNNSVKNNFVDKIAVKYLYLDFNSIVHVISVQIVEELNIIFYNLLSIKSSDEFKSNTNVQKIIDKYSPHLNQLSNIFNNLQNYSTENIINSFKSIFTIQFINTLVIKLTIQNVHDLIKTYIKNKLKLLYISIDGVPSKAKMIEQKGRRYMGALSSEYKYYLMRKYKGELKNAKTLYGANRYTYEKNKLHFNKSKISPGTEFMLELETMFRNEKFDCDKYILDGQFVIKEAEKKIIEHIEKNKYDDFVVYSPDADMILLVSLLEQKGIFILRHNQQTSTMDEAIYDLIDIDMFKRNIYEYLPKNIKISKRKYVDDIICLASMFGNDFIPKIESIDVSYNFKQILDIYLLVFEYFEGNKYLIEKDKEKKISRVFFMKFLELYWDKEIFNLKEQYMINTYKMYNLYKKVLNKRKDNVENDDNYINHKNFEKYNNLFEQYIIKVENIIRNNNMNILDDIFNKKYTKDDFISHVKKLVNYNKFQGLEEIPNNVNDYRALMDYINNLPNKDFFKLYIKLVKRGEKKIVRTYRDYKYKKTSKTARHQNKIMEMRKKGFNTNYDKEYYLFSEMLDGYKDKLNYEQLNIVNMEEKEEKTIKKYYEEVFKIDDYEFIESKHGVKKRSKKLDKVIHDYVEGLLWTFNYYYNEFPNIINWYYKWENAPLLRDIYIYLRDNDTILDDINKGLDKYYVEEKDFFNPLEQLMYNTPKTRDNEELVPKEYLNFFRNNEYYIDISKLVLDLKENVDCKGARYLNRCKIKPLENYDMEFDKQFRKELRKIKLSPLTLKRIGVKYTSKQERNIRNYKKYRELYINTGKIEYKKKYKSCKEGFIDLL